MSGRPTPGDRPQRQLLLWWQAAILLGIDRNVSYCRGGRPAFYWGQTATSATAVVADRHFIGDRPQHQLLPWWQTDILLGTDHNVSYCLGGRLAFYWGQTTTSATAVVADRHFIGDRPQRQLLPWWQTGILLGTDRNVSYCRGGRPAFYWGQTATSVTALVADQYFIGDRPQRQLLPWWQAGILLMLILNRHLFSCL